MILKDFKKFIPGWPEKRKPEENPELQGSPEDMADYEFNQAHEIFSNLKFNPAEMVDLDVIEIVHILAGNKGKDKEWGNYTAEQLKIAQAIVKAFKAGRLTE